MAEKNLHLVRGTAFIINDRGQREEVREIPATTCDCKLDCCYKALVLPDHLTGVPMYLYIYDGTLRVGTLSELQTDSTIL